MRAADADRDRVVERLNIAYSEGLLSKDEHDGRLENALSARTYADLDQLVANLPATRATAVTPVAKTSGLALASLACGLAQFIVGPPAAIPAIVLGHIARRQIKRTGEQGAGLALAGLILGWATVILAIVLIARPGHVRRDAQHHAHALSSRAPGIAAALLKDFHSQSEPSTADMAAELRRVIIAPRFKLSRPDQPTLEEIHTSTWKDHAT